MKVVAASIDRIRLSWQLLVVHDQVNNQKVLEDDSNRGERGRS